MNNASPFPVLELTGTPKQRGQIHGETLRDLVYEAVESWKYFIQQTTPPIDRTIDALVNRSHFLEAVKKWTPQLLEEVEGIAEGSNMPFNDIFALQLMDEGGWFGRKLDQPDYERCTSLGGNQVGDQPAILAQNLDWINIFKNLEVIFRIKGENRRPEMLVPSIPGVIGTCGLNELGMGVCTNAMWHFLNHSDAGLPVNFIVRQVLEMKTLDEVITFLQTIQHASGENYLVSDRTQVLDFECSANQVKQFIPFEDAQVVYHTNHPLVNDDLIYPPGSTGTSSHDRMKYLEFRLKNPSKRFTLETAKAILRSHNGPICSHQSYKGISGETEISVIYVLNDPPELLITKGPPCLTEYQRFTLG